MAYELSTECFLCWLARWFKLPIRKWSKVAKWNLSKLLQRYV